MHCILLHICHSRGWISERQVVWMYCLHWCGYSDVTGAVGLCASLFLAKMFFFNYDIARYVHEEKLSNFRCSSYSNIIKQHCISLYVCCYQVRNYASPRIPKEVEQTQGTKLWGFLPLGSFDPRFCPIGAFSSDEFAPLVCLTSELCQQG